MAMVSFGGSERHLPSLVVSQFQKGLQLIDKLMTALHAGDHNIKQHAKNAYAAFSKAESKLEDHIRHQTRKCRAEEAELSNMESRHQKIIRSLAGLSDSLASLSKRLEEQREKVANAQADVNSAEERVRKARSELEDAIETQKVVQKVGWATIWVPVVGASLLLVSETVLRESVENAEHSLDSTKSDLSSAENTLSQITTERRNTQDDISRREKEKTRMEGEMRETRKNISTCRNDINEQNRTLTALRKVMTRLGKVSGRAEVLRDATAIMHDIAEIGIPLKSLFDSFEEFITQPDLWRKVLSRPVFQAICDDDAGEWC
ncbi:tropomyosin-like [Haliotis asinina]|uniref:tropomyosin-like n=1 Tax=Haliotis asinina TaxID=109174 RepID=UPI0035325ABA